METFSALLAICAGNSPVTGEFPTQRPVTRSRDVFFDLCLNKRLSKQLRGWWLETTSRSLWHHCNDVFFYDLLLIKWKMTSFNGQWDIYAKKSLQIKNGPLKAWTINIGLVTLPIVNKNPCSSPHEFCIRPHFVMLYSEMVWDDFSHTHQGCFLHQYV